MTSTTSHRLPIPLLWLSAAALTLSLPAQLDRTFLARPLVRIAIADGEPTVDVTIGGKGPFRFVLDLSDAGDGALDTALARRLGLLRKRQSTNRRVTPVPELRMGDVILRGLDLRVEKLPSSHRGQLGRRAFGDVLLRIDRSRHLLEIYRGQLTADEDGVVPLDSRAVSRETPRSTPITLDVARRRMRRDPRPAAAAKGTHFDPGRDPQLRLRQSRGGHLLVRPRVDGRELGWFVFDTGATQTAISNRRAREAGLTAVGNGRTVTPTRIHKTTLWQTGGVEIGPMRVTDVRLAGLDLGPMARYVGGATGVLGGDVLRHCVVELDVAGGSIAIHDPARFELPGVTWRPLVLSKNIPLVAASFEGNDGTFLMDTGDGGTLTLFAPTVRRFDLLEGREVVREQHSEVGGSFELLGGSLASFTLGGHTLPTPPASFATSDSGMLGSRMASGSLGNALLEPFTVILDYPRERVAFLRREEHALSERDLDSHAGTYATGEQTACDVRRAGDRLLLRLSQHDRDHELVAETETRFRLRYGFGRCRFVQNRAGETTDVILTQRGHPKLRLRRRER